MKEIIELIRSNPAAETGTAADARHVMITRTELKKNGLPVWTAEFETLLSEFNGIYHNGSFVFGVKPENETFSDVLEDNLLLCPPENLLFLGYGEWDFLTYNAIESQYQLLDKNDLHVIFSGGLPYILHHFLKL